MASENALEGCWLGTCFCQHAMRRKPVSAMLVEARQQGTGASFKTREPQQEHPDNTAELVLIGEKKLRAFSERNQ
jgi:hypothetical protein